MQAHTPPACPLQTECTSVEVIDSEHHRTTGLSPGQYACWNPVSYDMCQRFNWQVKATLAGASGCLTLTLALTLAQLAAVCSPSIVHLLAARLASLLRPLGGCRMDPS